MIKIIYTYSLPFFAGFVALSTRQIQPVTIRGLIIAAIKVVNNYSFSLPFFAGFEKNSLLKSSSNTNAVKPRYV